MQRRTTRENSDQNSVDELRGQADPHSIVWTARVIIACATTIAAIGIIGCSGWITGFHLLSGVDSGYRPIAPSAAFAYLLLSWILFLCGGETIDRRLRYLAQGVVVSIAAVGGLMLLREFGIFHGDIEEYFCVRLLHTDHLNRWHHMSPVNAVALIIAAVGSLALLSDKRDKLRSVVSVLAMVLVMGGLTLTMAYSYDKPLFYGGPIIPIAFLSAVAMLLYGVGLVAAVGPSCWPLILVSGDSLRARFNRPFLITLLVVIFLDHLLKLPASPLGLANVPESVADSLLALSVFIIVSLVLSRNTSAITNSIETANAERVMAAEALRESEACFRSYFDMPLHGRAITSPQKGWIEVNDRLCSLLGYTRDEISSMTWSEMTHPDDLAADAEQFDRILAGEIDQYDLEKRFIRKDGTAIWTSLAVGSVRNSDGRLSHFVAVIEDITERKQAEEALAQSNQLLGGVLDNTSMMAVFLDSQFNFIWVNRPYAETCGHAPSFFPGKNHFDLYPNEENLAIFKRVVAKAEPFFVSAKPFEFPDQPERGVTYWDWSLIPLTDGDGSVTRLVFTLSDVTERIRALETIRSSAELFRNAFQYSPIGVALVSLEGKWLRINDSLASIVGYSEDELLTMTFQDITHPADLDTDLSFVRQMVDGEITTYTMEKRYLHKNGHIVWVLLAVSLVRDQDGAPLYFISQIEDITARKTAEMEIVQLNSDLEQRVKERTAQFESANKELEAFCYSVAHDLRAPLRHIDGYVDLLTSRCRENLPDQGLHYLDTIADSSRQMGVLIDDLLRFSRTGRTDMRMEILDMNRVLQEALDSLKESNPDRIIEWVIGDLPAVRGDSVLLRQVWVNLLGNAVKYTQPKETARIEVSFRKEKDEIIFIVQDNGVGFDMQYYGKLFGIFQRLHSQDEFEGVGIGLATVQRIIERHGGRVWAEAELNEGATFYFSLPQSLENNHA
ncbi:MAG: PAS domain S-box protein [Armatimonadota bacterium]